MRREDNKGFTLAELLIVVAIIGVLVAISIPIFSKQLEKARDATSVANLRSAYAEAMTADTIDYNGTKLSGSPTRVTSNGIKMDLYGQNGVVTAVVIHGVYLHSKSANNWSGMASNLPFYNLLSFKSNYEHDPANHADLGNYDGYYNIYFKLYSKDLSGQLTGVYIYQQAYDAKGNDFDSF